MIQNKGLVVSDPAMTPSFFPVVKRESTDPHRIMACSLPTAVQSQ